MENQLSEILDNLLGMLLLEGSYEIEETDEDFLVSIETKDAGRLIGVRGESLDSLQLLVNQMVARKMAEVRVAKSSGDSDKQPLEGFKRIVVDVEGWRKQKEEELKKSAESWGQQVLESGKEIELEPQSPWQRRIVHMVISEMDGLISESMGEGRDRHIVIKLKGKASKAKTEESNVETKEG